MKRAALCASVSIATLLYVGQVPVAASPGDTESFWNGRAHRIHASRSRDDEPSKADKSRRRQKSNDDGPDERDQTWHGRIWRDQIRHDQTWHGQTRSDQTRRKPSQYDSGERARHEPIEKKHEKRALTEQRDEKTPALPPGPLQVIVSIDKQRATLFAGGTEIAESKISSGTPGHPTPMGVFTVIQKSRHHISNLYDAPMPYMQRITWSGSALHEGPLPGYPASHGCVRLTTDFAKLLWRVTKIGARVIITSNDATPVPIESTRLSALNAKAVHATRAPMAAIQTADATSAVPAAVHPDVTPPLATSPAAHAASEEPTKLSIPRDVATEPPRSIIVDEHPATPPAHVSHKPVSVFVSLKAHRIYVRQGWEPLFDAPITIEHPERPIGTHVYTAIGPTPDSSGMRWTVVSIPSSSPKRPPEPPAAQDRHKHHHEQVVHQPTLPSATAALDRIVIPPDMEERIGAMVVPGSSLIVSDNKLSGETGDTTDFIVLTP